MHANMYLYEALSFLSSREQHTLHTCPHATAISYISIYEALSFLSIASKRSRLYSMRVFFSSRTSQSSSSFADASLSSLHTPAYVSIRQHTSQRSSSFADASLSSLHTPAYVSIRQHTPQHVSIRALRGCVGQLDFAQIYVAAAALPCVLLVVALSLVDPHAGRYSAALCLQLQRVLLLLERLALSR